MGKLILITGGARGGKSSFAETRALQVGGEQVLFVATAEAGDEEMAQRIEAHRQARPSAWQTLEVPQGVGQAVSQYLQRLPSDGGSPRCILVDCLTLLVSNILLSFPEGQKEQAQTRVEVEVASLVSLSRQCPATVLVVTNEVGFGIVPADALTRQYRDLLGRANATLAQEASEVYLLVAGLAVELKSLAWVNTPT